VSNLECCIDKVYIKDNKVIIEGWAYKSNAKEINISINETHEFNKTTIKRRDVFDKFNEEEAAMNSGFSISTEYIKKITLVVRTEKDESNIVINPKEWIKKENSGISVGKVIKVINTNNLKKLIRGVKNNGIKATYYKAKYKFKSKVNDGISYDKWIRNVLPTAEELEVQRKHVFKYNPKISIIIPTYNTKVAFLEEVIDSIINQTYTNWEICIADGASSNQDTIKRLKEYEQQDKRIIINYLSENYMISGNSNEALKLTTGEYIGLLDHDDVLTENALYEYVKVLNEDRDFEFIYSDEDKIDEKGEEYFDPHFKQDWAPDTFRSCNYICHFSVFSKDLLDKVGNFNHEFDGSQDYDIILRLTEQGKKIAHIPKVLYHWRVHRESTAGGIGAKEYCIDAGRRAVEAHLKRIGEKGIVKNGAFGGCYKVEYDIDEQKKVSIIIPNKDEVNTLRNCINSIKHKTKYKNYEIIIVENNSKDESIFEYYKELEVCNNIKVVTWKGAFNYSAINNFGVKNSDGDFVVLLNNDVEVISEKWLEELLMHAQRKEVGAVGAKLYYNDDTIQHYGVVLGVGGVAEHLGKGLGRYDGGHMGRLFMILNVTAVTGACLMMRRSLFDKLEGLNEELAVAYNDVDLCMKAREKGYLNVVTPYAELYHYESKSRGLEDSEEKVSRLKREMNLFNSIWGENIEDKYYNTNFSKEKADFKLSEN
jgi:GT2 family glycosyltransferase